MALKIKRGASKKPQKVVIYGPEGIGKTTLAAKFPDPLFIDTEGGTDGYDVARTQKPESWTELKGIIGEVASEKPCMTLVLDTADWAERMMCAELCASHKWDSMEALGYGKCWQYALEEFSKLLDALSGVRDAGMNVVVTAHAAVSKFEQPDEAAAYDRWTMKLYKKDAALLKEWADALLFVNYKTIVEVVGDGFNAKGKARGAKRTIFTTHQATWDAKNRWGLPDEIPLDWSLIAPYIPSQKPDAGVQLGNIAMPVDTRAGFPGFWKPVFGLMDRDGVRLHEVKAFAEIQGHVSEGTRMSDWPEDYVSGFLVPQWDIVKAKIEEYRKQMAI